MILRSWALQQQEITATPCLLGPSERSKPRIVLKLSVCRERSVGGNLYLEKRFYEIMSATKTKTAIMFSQTQIEICFWHFRLI